MSRRISITISAGLAVAATLMLAASPQQPALQEVQDLPSGHPSVSMPEKPDYPTLAVAEDIESVEAIVDAYYDSVSGAKGVTRDWNRFLSLFMPDARFIVSRTVDEKVVPMAMSAEEFVDSNKTYFERGGYFEKDIHREIDTFGNISQIFSTYATRRTIDAEEPYSRGINSFQLMRTEGRWWITTIMWESEMPDVNPIPAEYLPEEESDE